MIWRFLIVGFSLLPVVYMRDCRRSVAKDPGLDVHGLGFGVGYGHIYDPLQAFRLTTCDGGHTHTQTQRLSQGEWDRSRLLIYSIVYSTQDWSYPIAIIQERLWRGWTQICLGRITSAYCKFYHLVFKHGYLETGLEAKTNLKYYNNTTDYYCHLGNAVN